jgi:hypothetical protein
MVQAYGGIPPEALSVVLYTCPTMAEAVGQAAEVKAGAIVIAKAAVLLPAAESETFTENEALDAAVGVPEIWPAVLRVKPWGSAPEIMDQV